jgi:hypothetical protein
VSVCIGLCHSKKRKSQPHAPIPSLFPGCGRSQPPLSPIATGRAPTSPSPSPSLAASPAARGVLLGPVLLRCRLPRKGNFRRRPDSSLLPALLALDWSRLVKPPPRPQRGGTVRHRGRRDASEARDRSMGMSGRPPQHGSRQLAAGTSRHQATTRRQWWRDTIEWAWAPFVARQQPPQACSKDDGTAVSRRPAAARPPGRRSHFGRFLTSCRQIDLAGRGEAPS